MIIVFVIIIIVDCNTNALDPHASISIGHPAINGTIRQLIERKIIFQFIPFIHPNIITVSIGIASTFAENRNAVIGASNYIKRVAAIFIGIDALIIIIVTLIVTVVFLMVNSNLSTCDPHAGVSIGHLAVDRAAVAERYDRQSGFIQGAGRGSTLRILGCEARIHTGWPIRAAGILGQKIDIFFLCKPGFIPGISKIGQTAQRKKQGKY